MNPIISARGISKSFSNLQAVQEVNLELLPGEIYGLVGSDGAGKTTTLRLLVGALKADAGKIHICGYDVRKQGEQARAQIGYLSQRFSLYEDLTVLENIRFFAELRGLRQEEWLPRCMEILGFVGLVDFKERRAGQLSGGMKQKLGLASALVTRPRLLLLDEPTTGVDPVTRQDFWQLVIKLASVPRADSPDGDGKETLPAVLLTTPYMDEASRCHRVGFLREGRIIAEGTPSVLRERLVERIVEVRGGKLKILRKMTSKLSGVEDVQTFGDKIHLRIEAGRVETVLSALANMKINGKDGKLEARLVPPTLEDVFIELSGEQHAPGEHGLEKDA